LLSEFPLTVGITHCDTFGFFDMLVLDGVEETVQEARGEEA
jgi:hypothetical protein